MSIPPRPSRNGRRAAMLVLLAMLCGWAGPARAAPGDLDPSFDGDGKRTFSYGGGDYASAVLVQPDGKIVVAGFGNANTDFAVTRLNPDGSFDTGFDGDGTAGRDFGGADYGYAAALQPDGRIVVAGSTSVGDDIAVARFNPDGSLDATFDPDGTGGDGKKTINYGGTDVARAVLVQPDGKIVVAGYGGPSTALAVTRLNPDGSFDLSFDGDGTASADFGGDDFGYAAALQPDGKIVVAGRTSVNLDIAVARFNPTGPADKTLDETFAGIGKMSFGSAGFAEARAVLVQPDGKIVLAGTGGANVDVAVTRLNPDGSFDTSYDQDGTSGTNFGGYDRAYAAVLQPNGKIVVAGATEADGGNFTAARLQPGGALDTTFSFDGKATPSFGGDDEANAVALQPNGRILLAGYTTVDVDVAVARLEGDPPPVGGGGPGGGGPGGGPGAGPGVPRCAGKRATIVGTARRDVLRGTRRADVIVALGGNNRVRAARGNDVVCGGAGNDNVAGQSGRDRLLGGGGHDRLTGGGGNDRLLGQNGRDRLLGGGGHDRLTGGGGRDDCLGGGRDRAGCETKRSTSRQGDPR